MKRLVWLGLAICACGPGGQISADDDDGDAASATLDADLSPAPTPVLVAGGGVAPPALAGTLNVYVVASGGSSPIAGATVRVGTAADASPLTGVTDSSGLVVFSDPGLTGAQTVTATATGRTAATWIGATGANVTIPLDPLTRTVPTARVAGTIAGWSSLPTPAFGHYTLAVVLATFTDDIGAAENNLAQPTASDGTPLNTCVRTTASSPCNWQLVTRTGRQRHVAVIVDGNARGTTDVADDTYTLIGYATSSSATLSSGQQVNGESLTQVPAGSLTSLRVSFPPALSGLGEVVAIPQLDLGEDGRIVFPLPTVTPTSTSLQVINPTGAFAGDYRLVALASPPGDVEVPNSTVLEDSVALSGTAAIRPWLPAPRQVAGTGGAYSFTGADGASTYNASFVRADGATAWIVTLLDGATSFTLPAVSPDPLGSGGLTLSVTAIESDGFDRDDFSVPSMSARLRRASTASASVR